jgi:nucleoside-diphosphate-sugar epimerase
MRILVAGGTGMIGGHAALRLRALGNDVTIASRKPPSGGTPLAEFPFQRVDYVEGEPDRTMLGGFEAVLFCAGNDVRHAPDPATMDTYWHCANTVAVPRFLAGAKAAGVRHAVLIGSFYPQACPRLIVTNAYVESRLGADKGARALADNDFRVVVLNAPFVVGRVPGVAVPAYEALAQWALGRIPQIERYTVAGGVNVISCDTLTDAIIGALERGRNGKAYLVGDENLTFQQYFGLYLQAAGDARPLEVRDQEHPLLPDFALLAGRGSTIYYDPDPAEVVELGYRLHDVARTIQLIVDAVK